jgi:hypothetical protein
MARLGVPPHVVDKILNHQAGTISGVAAVYQRHDFLLERKEALDRWNSHVSQIIETFKLNWHRLSAGKAAGSARVSSGTPLQRSASAGRTKPHVKPH